MLPDVCPYPLSREEVENLYGDLSLDGVAKLAGTSRQRLARWMNFWGLKRRGTIQAMTLRRKQLGAQHGPNWKGGRWFSKSFRTWYVYAPGHPRARNGSVQEHFLVAEKRIGRSIKKGEVVHHLDEDPSNNADLNLCVMTCSEHLVLHRTLGDVGIAMLISGHSDIVLTSVSDADRRAFISAVYIERRACVSGLLLSKPRRNRSDRYVAVNK